jgi:hypothetical protein
MCGEPWYMLLCGVGCKGEVRENLGDFRKSIQILTFLSPLLHVPLPVTKTNVLHYDLKKDAINEFGIKY